jgi:hypothetical protein
MINNLLYQHNMRNFIFLFLFVAVTAHAQTPMTKPGRVSIPLPLSLWEYYAMDSTTFVYGALGRLTMYSSCNADQDGKVPGFTEQQNQLLSASRYITQHEGSPVYSLMEDTDVQTQTAQMRSLGLKEIPKIVESYAKFAVKNSAAITEGDSAITAQSWYYDSLLYAASSQGADFDLLYSVLRNPSLWIRYDGQTFEPNATGLISIKNLKGKRLEEIEVKNGIATGTSFTSNLFGEPVSDAKQTDTYLVSKYYSTTGVLATYDSTDLGSGTAYSKTYFPNGKLNAEFISQYIYDADGNLTGGGTTEKAYYSDGKLSCEIKTDTEGMQTIISANDRKGKSSITKGTGKVWHESIDLYGVSTINMNAYVKHVQSGLTETYMNNTLTSSWNMVDGIMIGSQKQFHWKNGKIYNETIYDKTGNYIEDKNTFDQNAPKIDASKVKVYVFVEPDASCSKYGVYDPRYTRATLKSDKETSKSLAKKYDLLHYNTDGLTPFETMTFKYITLDIAETGKPINALDYEAKDLEIINMLQFNPAAYQGKAIKSRVTVRIETAW